MPTFTEWVEQCIAECETNAATLLASKAEMQPNWDMLWRSSMAYCAKELRRFCTQLESATQLDAAAYIGVDVGDQLDILYRVTDEMREYAQLLADKAPTPRVSPPTSG